MTIMLVEGPFGGDSPSKSKRDVCRNGRSFSTFRWIMALDNGCFNQPPDIGRLGHGASNAQTAEQ